MYNLAVIGGGSRGTTLAKIARSARAKIIAVAEPNERARIRFQEEFGLPENTCFENHRGLLASEIKLDGAFVTTTPDYHMEAACDFLEAGIPLFLEKPMAANLEDAERIVDAARKTGTRIQVGFNCRYSPFFEKIKEIVSTGQLGQILSIEWKEVLSPYHWSTYCRYPSYNKKSVIGSWLLEKCCHDLDLINWFVESPCTRVASFGSRSYFNSRSELPQHCIDNCPIENKCMFSAFKFHPELEREPKKLAEFHALCVYNSGSDLVDHQNVILEYGNGVTAVFSLVPLIQQHQSSRFVYICGTKATLNADWTKNEVRLSPHESEKEIVCDPDLSVQDEHGGGDPRIVLAFLDYLDNPSNKPKTGVEEGWEAMVVGCGIDLSLKEHRVVELESLRNMGAKA